MSGRAPAVETRLRRALEARARYAAFRRHVEPEIASRTRLHRLARVPETGAESTPAVPLVVIVDFYG